MSEQAAQPKRFRRRMLPLPSPRSIVAIAGYSMPQGGVAAGTFVLTLALAPRIDVAVLLGIGLGVAVHLLRELRFNVEADYSDGVLWIRPNGVLYFGSTPALQLNLLQKLSNHPEATKLVIDLSQLGRIDYTGALALRTVMEEATKAGLEVSIEEVPPHAARRIAKVWEGAQPNPLKDL